MGSFVFPKASEKDITAAYNRIQKALMQVPDYAHFDLNRQRNTTTLYLGNLDYNASEQDLSKALAPLFQRTRLENITIPKVKGRSVYGFIDISWDHDVMIEESDLCTIYTSGKVQVNGRPIYFRPLRDKAGSQ
jgi:RNA recognition motif-containing protein